MNPIAIQPYIKVQREVDLFEFEQKFIEEERNMYLYHDKIVTQYREFSIEKVFDISYKKFGEEAGLLYLHTLGGLYSYTVKIPPHKFIEAFKSHVANGGPF